MRPISSHLDNRRNGRLAKQGRNLGAARNALNGVVSICEQGLYSLRSIIVILSATVVGTTESVGRIAIAIAIYVTIVSGVTAATAELLFSSRDVERVMQERSESLAAALAGGCVGAASVALILSVAQFDVTTTAITSLAIVGGSVADTKRLLLLRIGKVWTALRISALSLGVVLVAAAMQQVLYGWLAAVAVAAVAAKHHAPLGSAGTGVRWLNRYRKMSFKSAAEVVGMTAAGQSSIFICAATLSLGEAGMLRTLQALLGPATIGLAGLRLHMVSLLHQRNEPPATWLPRKPVITFAGVSTLCLGAYVGALLLLLPNIAPALLPEYAADAQYCLAILGGQAILALPGVLVPSWLRLHGQFGLVLSARVVAAFVGIISLLLGSVGGGVAWLVSAWMAGTALSACGWWSVLASVSRSRRQSKGVRVA